MNKLILEDDKQFLQLQQSIVHIAATLPFQRNRLLEAQQKVRDGLLGNANEQKDELWNSLNALDQLIGLLKD